MIQRGRQPKRRPAAKGPVQIRGTGEKLELTVVGDQLPPPTASYAANWAGLTGDDVGVSFLFGKLIPMTTELSSILEVRYDRDSFDDSFITRSVEFRELLRTLVASRGAKQAAPKATPPDPKRFVPETLVEHASLEIMAYHGLSAEIGFFMLSPTGFQLMKRTGAVPANLVRPIVSVVLGAPLLLYLLDLAHEEHKNRTTVLVSARRGD